MIYIDIGRAKVNIKLNLKLNDEYIIAVNKINIEIGIISLQNTFFANLKIFSPPVLCTKGSLIIAHKNSNTT